MRRTVLIALVTLIAAPAFAQGHVTPPDGLEDPIPPPPGSMSISREGHIAMAADLCARLRRAEAAEAGPEFRPGVDVHGDEVAPADLPSERPPALEHLPIVIGPGLQKRYGIAANSGLLRHRAMVGEVTVRDGRAYFNGERISDRERDMMLAACREARR
jgi:hypothetical protein